MFTQEQVLYLRSFKTLVLLGYYTGHVNLVTTQMFNVSRNVKLILLTDQSISRVMQGL